MINNVIVYHFFHAGLEHHNVHMMPIFDLEDANKELEHRYVLIDPKERIETKEHYHFVLSNLREFVFFLYRQVNRKDTLIIHGLYSNWYYLIPLIRPMLSSRVIWDIWGDDFFSTNKLVASKRTSDKIRYLFRRFSIPKFGALAGFKGDVEAVCSHYGHREERHYINHPLRSRVDNISVEGLKENVDVNVRKILIGNSGSKSNQHARAIEQLRKLPNFSSFSMYCIFSTDVEQEYYQEFQQYLKLHSIDNIHIIEEAMSESDFITFIQGIDVVIMPHSRQQGVGTTNLSILLGKPVFMDVSVSTASYYQSEGVAILDVEQLCLLKDFNDCCINPMENATKVKRLFGRTAVTNKWKSIIQSLNNYE